MLENLYEETYSAEHIKQQTLSELFDMFSVNNLHYLTQQQYKKLSKKDIKLEDIVLKARSYIIISEQRNSINILAPIIKGELRAPGELDLKDFDTCYKQFRKNFKLRIINQYNNIKEVVFS